MINLKYIKRDAQGRIMVKRNFDSHWLCVSAYNFNTQTVQVGGSKTDYPTLVELIGEDAAKELIDYIVLDIYSFGER